jgi:phage terminase small subunit
MAKRHAPRGKADSLTPQQERFVAEYLIDLNATQAAIRAGYSAKTAQQQGARLLLNVVIGQAVAAGKAKQLETAGLSAARVLEELRRLAFSDVRHLFDATGNLLPLSDLTPEQSSAIASIEVIIKNAKAGDGVTDTIHKLRVWDKTRALEMLSKHFGLLTEKVEHSGGLTIKHELPDA